MTRSRYDLEDSFAVLRIRIQGVKYQPKTEKKPFILLNNILLNPKSELLKKREITKISSFLNDLSSFRIKICEKNAKKFQNYFLLKRFSKSY